MRVPAMIRWPNKIPSGQITNDIVHMTDVLPTLASAAGYEVPNDRMIDGIDQMNFFMGNQEKSDREGFPIYNGDELFAYKWGNWKMHFIELNSMFGTPLKLNMPHLHNLIEDPKELYSVDRVDVSASWVFPQILGRVVEFKKTLAIEKPIPLGTPDPYTPN
jgi:arylsulfatase